jgi:transcriptional regulator with XRE-family HTH domain
MCYDAQADRIATGKRIHHKMIDCDVSAKELAQAAGCTPQMISAILCGDKYPSLPILRAIASRLECKIDELVH